MYELLKSDSLYVALLALVVLSIIIGVTKFLAIRNQKRYATLLREEVQKQREQRKLKEQGKL